MSLKITDLFCQLRLMPSHFSGVVTMTSALSMARMSGELSPVSSTTLFPSLRSIRSFQSSTLSLTSAFSGAIYTALPPG